jgi:hypothetical protein
MNYINREATGTAMKMPSISNSDADLVVNVKSLSSSTVQSLSKASSLFNIFCNPGGTNISASVLGSEGG